jgi:ABC-type transporter MlaC component
MAASTATLAAEYPDPKAQLEPVFAQVVDDVAALRAASAVTDCALYAVIDSRLRSQFGLYRSGKAMLIRDWPTDDPASQERFVDALYDYLVAKYGDLLIHVDSETLRLIPLDVVPEEGRASLEGVMTMTDGEEVDVNLTLRFEDDLWRIVDVVSERSGEGRHSQARSYSDLFRGIIHDEGFDGLIEWMREKAAPLARCG